MTVTVYPLDAVSGAPSYTGRMLRETIASLFAGATSTRPLGIISGVRPGTPTDCITLSGLNYSLAKPFAGAVDAESAGEAGPYLFAVSGTQTGSIAAQDASNPRKDILSITINDNAEDGGGAANGALVYTQGVAAGSPGQPATPARSLLLGRFDVPKNGTGSPTFTWLAPTLSAAGGIPPVGSVAARLATFPSPVGNEVVYRTDLGYYQQYLASASAWRGVTGSRIARVALNGTTTVDNLATAFADFDAVKLIFGATGATANDFYFKLRRGGADVSTGYANQVMYANSTTTTATPNYGGTTQVLVSAGGGSVQSGEITLFGLTKAALVVGTAVVAGYATALLPQTTAFAVPSLSTDDGFKFGRTGDPANLAGFVDIIGI